jgi:outer membrane cobalamin receptor
MSMITRWGRAIALLVPFGTVCAWAAESSVVITATRLNEEFDESLASVTVIERAEIDRLQARTLDELLRGVEGINIARQGGIGQPTSLYMRGGESDHVLWLIDGVRIGSVSAGIPAIQDLPIDSIERIEIVRGVRSSLYGPDAMGGVVQIFTLACSRPTAQTPALDCLFRRAAAASRASRIGIRTRTTAPIFGSGISSIQIRAPRRSCSEQKPTSLSTVLS